MTRPGPSLVDALIGELDDAADAARLAGKLIPYLAPTRGELRGAEQTARQLGLHPDTLVRMARDGRIPGARKVGREWRFPAEVEVQPKGCRAVAAPAPARRARLGQEDAATAAIRGA